MSWSDDAICWQVYPLGFLGAEQRALPPSAPIAHRLPSLANWLGYLVDLGCNVLALGPVFASETHGYDTVDHFRLDPRLGDEDDLLALVGQASERGVRVVLDGVFNHVGRSFPAFLDVQAHGGASAFASWFRPDPGAPGGFEVFEGHDSLVALNHDNDEVVDYVAKVMLHWLDRGAAGWRLDAAYAVPPRAWSEVTRRVRAKYPDAWLVGEVIHGDYGAYVNEGGLSSVTQDELWKAIWSSLNDRNFYELAWTLDRHNSLLESFAPMTFLGNHDVTRLASQLVDERHLAHALVVLLTVGGVPSIYYGDERAYRGLKEDRPGGDDAVRPIFPDSPSGVTNEGSGYVRLHQLLIGLRRRHPWLVRARTTVLALANTSLSYTVSDRTNSDQLCVALNVGPGAAALTMPPGKWRCVAGKGQAQEGVAHLASEDWAIFAEGTEP